MHYLSQGSSVMEDLEQQVSNAMFPNEHSRS